MAIRRADAEFDLAAFDGNRDGTVDPGELVVLVVIPRNNPFGTARPPYGRRPPTRARSH